MAGEYVIHTQGLTRYFGAKAAVYELDLAVPRGCVFALLGRNGSGKTTAIRMLLGLLEPTRGSAAVLGCDCRCLTPQFRGRIGYMAETHPVYGWMEVRQAGRFQSQFHPRWNARVFDAVLEHFRIDSSARAASLSRGERAGLSLALTLAPEPELLILDDPALGLDPVARRALMEAMVVVTRQHGRTIFFSSHMVDDVERVADLVAVLDYAVLRAQCPMDVFRQRVRRVVLRFGGPPPQIGDLPGLLQAEYGVNEVRLIYVAGSADSQQQLQAMGAAAQEEIPLSLEEAMIAYMGPRGRQSHLRSLLETSENQEAGVP